MLWKKLHSLLDSGEAHKYRFLLSLHYYCLRGFAGLQPIESLVPAFETDIDPSHDANGFMVSRFLHDNQLKRVLERDSAGWSPLCYAVLGGNVSLVRALLQRSANPNDIITKAAVHANLPTSGNKVSVLALAAAYRSLQVPWACASDNVKAVHLLLEAKADCSLNSHPGLSSFRSACCCGSLGVMNELLASMGKQVSLRFCLRCTLAFNGDIHTISCLIKASADVNERL